MTRLEAELRAWQVELTPEQWERYREWAQENPNGGGAIHGARRTYQLNAQARYREKQRQKKAALHEVETHG